MSPFNIALLVVRIVARIVTRVVIRVALPSITLLGMVFSASAVQAATIEVDGTTCLLADAIIAANTDAVAGGCSAGSGEDTLNLTATTYALDSGAFTNNGSNALPSISSIVTIQGNGASIMRTGATAYRLFHILENGDLTLDTLTIRDGNVATHPELGGNARSGGAIYNRGTLTVLNSQLIANSARFGGAIFNINSSTTILTDSIIANSNAFQGGGIFNDVSTVILVNSSIVTGTVSQGGGLYNYFSTATLTNSNIADNEAEAFGGAMYNEGSTVSIADSTIADNTALRGGGLHNYLGETTVSGSALTSNRASIFGGGIYNEGGTISVSDSEIRANESTRGAGIYVTADGETTITDSSLSANHATSWGGGIYNTNFSNITLTGSVVISNTAEVGAGIYNRAMLLVSETTLLANLALTTGGGLYQEEGQVTFTQGCIVGNSDPAVLHQGGETVNASNNWWGTTSGPGGVGPGTGDNVNNRVVFTPFLTAAILGCPSLPEAPETTALYLPNIVHDEE